MFGSKKAKIPAGPPGPIASGADGSQASGIASARSQDRDRDPVGKTPAVAGGVGSEEAQRRAAIAIRQSLAFAQIISVLMRSPHYKHYTLADLEWLVLPALLTGQFSVAEASAKEGGPRFPVAVVLWARVSADVDKRLSENFVAPIRLRPDEWCSGEILWLVDAVGDGRVVLPLLKQLGESVWKGRQVKMRIAGEGGKPHVKHLSDIHRKEAEKPNPAAKRS